MASERDGGLSCDAAQASDASSTDSGNLTTAVGAAFGLPIFFLLFVTESACFFIRVTVTESQAERKLKLPIRL